MTKELDLVRLNLRAPLVEAVCATMCSDWSEAADLWLDVGRDPDCRALAAQCGLQAALTAGLMDLAEYFYIGVGGLSEMPGYLSDLWTKQSSIRAARVRFYSEGIGGAGGRRRGAPARELMRLHLYREAIREIFVSQDFRNKPKESLPLLARAYFMLGAHTSLMGLYNAYKIHLQDADSTAIVQRAERLLSRRAEPPARNLMRFQEQHPAGAELGALIELRGRPLKP